MIGVLTVVNSLQEEVQSDMEQQGSSHAPWNIQCEARTKHKEKDRSYRHPKRSNLAITSILLEDDRHGVSHVVLETYILNDAHTIAQA